MRDFAAKTAVTIFFGVGARQRNMSGCADEVWGGKDRSAAILFTGIIFGDGIDHLAIEFSVLRCTGAISVHVFPALRASLNYHLYQTLRDPIAVTN